MQIKEKERVIEKAKFYFENNLKCHIKIRPTGSMNGKIISELIDDLYYWFDNIRQPGKKERLFLIDIFDIKDYEEVEE